MDYPFLMNEEVVVDLELRSAHVNGEDQFVATPSSSVVEEIMEVPRVLMAAF